MTFKSLLILAAVATSIVGLAGPLTAADDGPMQVEQPWARASLGVVKVGAAYLTIVNQGRDADRLIGLSSPVAGRAVLHGTTMLDGVMKMRALEALELAAGETVALEPGGLHIMLMGLKQPLKEGQRFLMTLHFAEAGDVVVQVQVDKATASGPRPALCGWREDHADLRQDLSSGKPARGQP